LIFCESLTTDLHRKRRIVCCGLIMHPLLSGVFLLVAIAAGNGASISKSGLSKSYCSWGSQYWCSSPKTAALCRKTDWCSDNFWPHGVSEDLPCIVTQKLVTFSRDLLLKSEPEELTDYDIALKLAKGCSIFTELNDRKQCKTIVTSQDSLLKLVQLITTNLPTKTVALAVGTCQRNTLTSDSNKVQTCTKCEDVVATSQTYIRKFYTAEVNKKVFKSTCAKLGHGKNVCLALAVEQYRKIYDALLSVKPTTVCSENTECFKSPSVLIKQSGDLCSTCQNVVSDIRSLDRSAEVQEVIKKMVKAVCVELGPFEQMCNVLADEGLQYFFELIATEMEPVYICEILDFCTLPAKTNTPVARNASSFAPQIPKIKTSVPCIVCQFVLTEVESFLELNSTEKTLESVLDDVCNRLPPTVSDECTKFVTQYGPMIIKLIEDKVKPDVMCYMLTLCKNNSMVVNVKPEVKPMPKVNDELCDLCKYVVTYIDTFLKENATEAEIEAILEKVCDILPGNLKQQCDSLVQQYGPVIIQLLLQKLDPSQVCTAIGLCKNNTVILNVKPEVQPVTKANSEICDLCKYVVTFIDTFLQKNATEAEVEALLEKVCDILPESVKQQCDSFVEQYGPIIIQLLLQEADPTQVCTFIKMCTSNSGKDNVKSQAKLVPQANDELCDLCKYVVTYIDTFVKENATEAEIEAILDKVCDILPASIKQQCENLVQQYGPLIIQLLLKELDPTQVCTAIGLCTNNIVKENPQANPVTKANDELCDLCKYVVTYIDTFVKENATEAEIEAILEKVCDILPASIKQQCENLVDQYGPLIIQLLIKELDPTQVCTAIGLCTNTGKVQLKDKLSPKVNDELCDLCKYVVTYIDTFVKENATEAEIEAILDKVCDILPASIKQQCENLVQQYGPLIIQLLLKELDPTQVCTAIGLCTNNIVKVKPQVDAVTKVNDELCDLCKYVVTYIDTFVKENATEAEIETILEKVCDILPASIKQQCETLVQQYGPFIIQLLLKELDPTQVCTAIGLCTNNIASSKLSPKTSPGCAVCEFVMQELDSILADNSTEAQIESALDKVCDFLPSSLSSECQQFVESYAPMIIQLLKTLKPQQICTALGLCTKVTTSTPYSKASGSSCALCEFIMTEVDTYLGENSTEAEIEEALDKVCDLLPQTLKSECDSIMEQYGPIIFSMLVKKMDPKTVCTAIHLCSAKSSVSTAIKKTSIKKNELCALCIYVLTTVDTLIESKASKQEIIAALDKVCDYLPSTVKEQCESFVGLYLPYVVDLIVQELTPQQICEKLGLCVNQTVSLKVKSEIKPVSNEFKDELCDLCKYVVTYIDTFLKENATEAEIEAILEKVCDILPGNLKQQCDSLVQQYGPVIIQLLLQKLDPSQVCTAIGLCTSNTVNVNPEAQPVRKSNSEICDLCKYVVTYIDTFLQKNATEAEIEALLEKVCDILPGGLKQQCDSFVEEYGPVIIQLLLQEADPTQICTFIKMCTSNTVKTQAKPVPQANDELCDLCKYVVTYIDTFVKENNTEAEIEAILEKVCDILPASIKQQCENLVQQYGPLIIQLLIKELDPTQVCTAIGLCTNNGVKEVKPQANPVTKVNDELCDLCKYVVTYIDTFVKENATEAEIEAILEKVCDILPASIKQQCENLVDQYGPLIIQLLIKELDPTQVCTAIGLCTNTGKVQLKDKPSPKVNDELCDLCKYVVTYIDTFVKENATEAEIEAILDKVCDILPASIKQQCENLVQQYGPLIIQLLLKELDPTQVCTAIGLCTNNAGKENLQAKPVNDELCDLCKYVVTYIDTFLKENATEAEIEAILEKVCDILPGNLKQQCDSLVQQYGPVIIQLLLQKLDPSQVCTAIGLCKNNTVILKLKSEAQPVPKTNAELCDMCKYVVTYIDTLLKKNATEAEIEALLNKVCDLLPASIKQQCDNLVQQYGPIIIQLLINEADPTQVCTFIGLCTSDAEGMKRSTSLRKETSGPACALCEFVIQELDNILAENSSQAQIEAALDKICTHMPSSLTEECHDFLKTYGPLILQMLIERVQPQKICTAIKLCPSQPGPLLKTSKVNSGPECAICELILKYLEALMTENSTEEQIESALYKVCSLLPATVQRDCTRFVSNYTSELVSLLSHFPPEQVCALIKACTVPPQKSTDYKGGPECPLCEFIMQQLEGMISKNASEQQIEQALEKVCSLLPSTVRAECDSYVKTYTPILVHLLVKMSPDQICTYLKFCTSDIKAHLNVKSLNNGHCALCEFILAKLDGFLSKNLTQSEIEKALDVVCYVLPGTLRSDCENFISQYGPVMIKLLLQETRPRQVCIAAGICTNSGNKALTFQSDRLDPPTTTPVAMEHCSECKFALYFLQNSLVDPFWLNQSKIISTQVCKLLKSGQDDCLSLLNSNFDTVVNAIVAFRFPIEFCQKIALCEAPLSTITGKSNHKELTLTVKDDPTTTPVYKEHCSECKFALFEFQSALADPFWQDKFKLTSEVLCSYLQTGQDTCRTLVDSNIDSLISLITSYNFPIDFCQSVDFCEYPPPNLKTAITLGGTECELCKILVQLLDVFLQANKTVSEVEKVLNAACKLFPASDKEKCESIVRNYTPTLMQLLSQLDDPIKVCQVTNLCPKTNIHKNIFLFHHLLIALLKVIASFWYRCQTIILTIFLLNIPKKCMFNYCYYF
ncbi:hypothetical protein Btru_008134, partial [Bulinus truncatus]